MANFSISVVMATYNGTHYLREQLRSVLDQLLQGDELIIVDDDSQDGTFELILSFESSKVRIIRNPVNLGVLATFERGLLLAKNEFIFLCDQDDVWLPGKRTAFLAAFAQDPSVSVVISDSQVIDAQGRVIAPSFMETRRGFDGSLLGTLWRNRYLGCAMALRRRLLSISLPVPRQVPMHDMWFGAMGQIYGKVVYLPTPFLQWRRHTDNASPSHHQSISRKFSWRMALFVSVCLRMVSFKLGLQVNQLCNTHASKEAELPKRR